MNLQPPEDTARRVTPRLVVSCTTFSPLPRPTSGPRRLFSSVPTCRRRQLLFSEVERPALPGLSSRARKERQRQSRNTAFQCAKVRLFHEFSKLSPFFFEGASALLASRFVKSFPSFSPLPLNTSLGFSLRYLPSPSRFAVRLSCRESAFFVERCWLLAKHLLFLRYATRRQHRHHNPERRSASA